MKFIRSYCLALVAGLMWCPATMLATDYAQAVTNTPGLLGYWRFDPVFQTNSVVNGYTGSLLGTARIGGPQSGCPLPSDPDNQGLLLDGASGYFTTSLSGQITGGATVLAWVYLTAEPSAVGHIFQITSQAAGGNDFDFQIQTDNHLYFFTDSGSATVYSQPLPVNQWHFLAATFVANSTRCLYLDGQLVASSNAGSHSVNNTPLWIGNNRVFGPRLFQGRIDEVAVFSQPLPATSIAGIYAAALAPTLHLELLNASTVLSWSTNFPGYLLQSSPSLIPAIWSNVKATYWTNALDFSVTNSLSGRQMFFRLKD